MQTQKSLEFNNFSQNSKGNLKQTNSQNTQSEEVNFTVCDSHKKINGKFGSLKKHDDVVALNDDIKSQGSESSFEQEEIHQSENNMTVQS